MGGERNVRLTLLSENIKVIAGGKLFSEVNSK